MAALAFFCFFLNQFVEGKYCTAIMGFLAGTHMEAYMTQVWRCAPTGRYDRRP